MAAVRCYHLLTNVDENAREFIAAYGSAQVSTSITTSGSGAAPAPAAGGKRDLTEIVLTGLKGEAGPATKVSPGDPGAHGHCGQHSHSSPGPGGGRF